MPLNSNSLDLSSGPYLSLLVSSEAQRCQLVRKWQILWKRHSITSCEIEAMPLTQLHWEGRIILLQKGHICRMHNLFSLLNLWITLLWVEHSWMLTQSAWMSLLSMHCGFQFAQAQAWLSCAEQRAKDDGRRTGRHKAPETGWNSSEWPSVDSCQTPCKLSWRCPWNYRKLAKRLCPEWD